MTEDIQNLTIELNTTGRNTIPLISPENIITIHGKNGVGKSMAATLLEIASGNYTFENENRFKKLANVIDSCEISFKINNSLLYKVILKPHIWDFDNNLNRVNPITLGKFLKGPEKKEINFNEFSQNIYIRTIRGNESLQQQIYFFKDIFVAKLKQNIEKLEKKLHYLNEYKDQLEERAEGSLIEKYLSLQGDYTDILNHYSNLKSSISNRNASSNTLKKKLELLEKLEFIGENDKDLLKNKKEDELYKVTKTQEEISSNYESLTNIKTQLENLKEKFDDKTKDILQKLEKIQKKRDVLLKDLEPQIASDLEDLDEEKYKTKIETIEGKIEKNQKQINDSKKIIESLSKESERIIDINNYLTRIRDITSKASSHNFGKEKIIKVEINGKKQSLSFQDLFEIFQNNNLKFKQNEELKEYKKKVQEYNKSITENRKNLNILTEFRKVQGKIIKLKKELKGKTSQLDSYIDLETKINSLEKKKQERLNNITKLEKNILEYKGKIKNFTKIIEDISSYPSKNSIINDLNKLGTKFEKTDNLKKRCEKLSSEIKKETDENSNYLRRLNQQRVDSEQKIKKLKDEISPISQKIKIAAKNFGFSEKGVE